MIRAKATGVGVDCKAAAVTLARRNALTHGLSSRCVFLEGDAHALSLVAFDLVFSTLPWVPTGQLDDLMPEVRLYDPIESLDGGVDGLDHFRRMAKSLHVLWVSAEGALFRLDMNACRMPVRFSFALDLRIPKCCATVMASRWVYVSDNAHNGNDSLIGVCRL